MPEVSITFPESIPAPEAVNAFNFVLSGPEIQMLVGYADLRQFLDLPGDKQTEVPVAVLHCFLMSPRAFVFLKQQVDEIWASMERELQSASEQEINP